MRRRMPRIKIVVTVSGTSVGGSGVGLSPPHTTTLTGD